MVPGLAPELWPWDGVPSPQVAPPQWPTCSLLPPLQPGVSPQAAQAPSTLTEPRSVGCPHSGGLSQEVSAAQRPDALSLPGSGSTLLLHGGPSSTTSTQPGTLPGGAMVPPTLEAGALVFCALSPFLPVMLFPLLKALYFSPWGLSPDLRAACSQTFRMSQASSPQGGAPV